MTRDAANISTEYQPKGSDRNQSDTLDRPEAPDAHVGPRTRGTLNRSGTADVVDEKGRPLNGDGIIKK